jgi:hypothetical protein
LLQFWRRLDNLFRWEARFSPERSTARSQTRLGPALL